MELTHCPSVGMFKTLDLTNFYFGIVKKYGAVKRFLAKNVCLKRIIPLDGLQFSSLNSRRHYDRFGQFVKH